MRSVKRFKLVLWLFLGVGAVSCAAIFIRYAQAQAMPTLVIALWRLIFACALLCPYAWFRHGHEIRAIQRRDWIWMGGAGIFLGLHFAAWIGSLAYTTVARSVVLVAMGPIFIGLGSWLFLKERLSRHLIIGIVCAALGSVVMCGMDPRGGHSVWRGDLFALLGALCVACYLILGRSVRGRCSLFAYIGPVYTIAMVTLLILVLCCGYPLLGYTPAAYAWVLLLGWIPQLIGHTVLNWALRYVSATIVAVVTLAEPIGSALLATLLLQEPLDRFQIGGGLLILVGVYFAFSRSEPRLDSGRLNTGQGESEASPLA